jgi:hypothetical protein
MVHALADAGAISLSEKSRFLAWNRFGNVGVHLLDDEISVEDAEYFLRGLKGLAGVAAAPERRSPLPDSGTGGSSPAPERPRASLLVSGDERLVVSDRIRRWAGEPDTKIHKMIAIVVGSPAGIRRGDLVRRVGQVTHSRNPYGAVSSMLTTKGNAYGRVCIDVDGVITIHPDVADLVHRFQWKV